MNAHWHIFHALVYVGSSCDAETREQRIKECIDLLAKDLDEKENGK